MLSVTPLSVDTEQVLQISEVRTARFDSQDLDRSQISSYPYDLHEYQRMGNGQGLQKFWVQSCKHQHKHTYQVAPAKHHFPNGTHWQFFVEAYDHYRILSALIHLS